MDCDYLPTNGSTSDCDLDDMKRMGAIRRKMTSVLYM